MDEFRCPFKESQKRATCCQVGYGGSRGMAVASGKRVYSSWVLFSYEQGRLYRRRMRENTLRISRARLATGGDERCRHIL